MTAGRLAELLGAFALANPDVELSNVTVVEFAGWCRKEGYTKVPPAENRSNRGHARMVKDDCAEKVE